MNKILVHLENKTGFEQPVLFLHSKDFDEAKEVKHSRYDAFGAVFELEIQADEPVVFKFGQQSGELELDDQASEGDEFYRGLNVAHVGTVSEVWCRPYSKFVYTIQPAAVSDQSAADAVAQLDFAHGVYVSESDGRFALGAQKLAGNGVQFGLFHPHAARVFVAGDFNDWQHPGLENSDPEKFLEMSLHVGYFDRPNVWLCTAKAAESGQAYKFYIEYSHLAGDSVRGSELVVDPYSRYLGDDFERNDSLIIDPTTFEWSDDGYSTPAVHDLIIYELHVHGFTHDHADIDPDIQGTFQALTQQIESGYFEKVGATCLYLMPISEVPTPQGRESLGYNTSLFMAVERDFGRPDDLRQLVNTAHAADMAVIIDQVFNHSANSWNPLWKFITDHPSDFQSGEEGGLYFSGESPWGNRVSTERTETQNMLIDACKMMMVEYHIDGFRFDATHRHYMDHGFLHRLAAELQALKPDVILIAENLPNESDLNLDGYNGYAQWCDPFHDAMKALLREGEFEGAKAEPDVLGDIFYFAKQSYAAHTNNVINYVESHDEHSVAHEVSFVDELSSPAAKERKARLGLFASVVALGQPMIYMGQEFGVERSRNIVYFDRPENLDEHHFFQWATRLLNLRKRYPALKLHGFDPIGDGQFEWLIAPWLGDDYGKDQLVIGWRSVPNDNRSDEMVVLLNFANHPIELNVNFGRPGIWVRLASIDQVNDIGPVGGNTAANNHSIVVSEGGPNRFELPDSSGFIYKWQAE